jgi:hypothetical protein
MMEQNQVRPRPVSKRMVLVIVIALLFILLPATISGLPFSRIRISVVNEGTISADCNLRVYGDVGSDAYESFNLNAGDTYTMTVSVHPGTYQISLMYSHYDPVYGYDYDNAYDSCTAAYFQTEQVTINIYP